jgi:hypothetical protein
MPWRAAGIVRELGARVQRVNALHEKAASFQGAYGFRETTDEPHTLHLPLGIS